MVLKGAHIKLHVRRILKLKKNPFSDWIKLCVPIINFAMFTLFDFGKLFKLGFGVVSSDSNARLSSPPISVCDTEF